jgi:hypothetical protein
MRVSDYKDRNTTRNSKSNGAKSTVSDRRYVKRDRDGKFVSTKADKMFKRAWKDTYEKRERRVG